jgi:hypothetical protein
MTKLRVAACSSAIASLLVLCCGTPATASARAFGVTPRLTVQGELLWQFEGLLRLEFGDRAVWSTYRLDFNCSGVCAPLSKYAHYRYVFRGPAESRFRLSSRQVGRRVFGNYPTPVRIRGKLVSCGRGLNTFLVAYSDAVTLTLGCLMPHG